MPIEEKIGLQPMDIMEPLYKVKGWIKLICIVQIMAGVFHVVNGLYMLSKMYPVGLSNLFTGVGLFLWENPRLCRGTPKV
jgi:hypothetical protein